jgi:hypothetical protein
MTRRVQRVPYHLDARGIRSLPEAEIRAILRGADDLIMRGGRSLLVKVLKGSHSKDVLSQSLDRSPVYGYFELLTPEEVLARIDWVILKGYLTLEYDYRLPLLIYTPKGWAIEREIYADELLEQLNQALTAGPEGADLSCFKDKNREVIWLLLDRVQATGDKRYIPLLSAWAEMDYKKVRQRIRQVITLLSESQSETGIVADRPSG